MLGRLGYKALMLGWLLLATASGCARLPAIDPNGQNIFLPYPATTRIDLPQIHAGNGNPGIIPQDAYPTPMQPPPCLDGSGNQPGGVRNLFQHHQQKKAAIANYFAKKTPGQCGEIQLSNSRWVAPVNGEVLLLAGICGKDGYLLKREPLEWMLAPGSVGNFIEVGDDNKGRLCASLRSGPKVEKLGVDYARGRTSSRETLLTKGTPGCDDDVKVAEGQTWLSISSPNEGVSRVTVLAPESQLWDKRRQIATIYWVDSAASFPESVRLSAPGPAQLVTRAMRSQNRPAVGWKVRYTIIDPNVAAFVPQIASSIFVTETNQDGQAVANITAPPGSHGATAVHIEVIRPAQPDEDLPELVLHQADTWVTFSSPGLDVVADGPASAGVGDIVEYQASMINPGDLPTENAVLSLILPAGTTLIGAEPQPSRQTPNGLLWEQGILDANQQLEVRVRLRLDATGDKAIQFNAQGGNLQKQAQPVVTRVISPSVDISFRPTSENTTGEAEVGEVITYEVGVRNTGPQTLVNVEVIIETSPGWQEAYQNSHTVRHVIPMLQPGQSDISGVAFRVLQAGRHTAQLTIKSSGGSVLRQAPAEVMGVARRPRTPRMETNIKLQPERVITVGQKLYAYFFITNTGETTLSNLEAIVRHDAALRAKSHNPEQNGKVSLPDTQTLRWTPSALQPGSYDRLVIEFDALGPVTAAGIAMTAVNAELTSTAQASIQIDSSSPGPSNPGGQVLPPNLGRAPDANSPGANSPGASSPGGPAPAAPGSGQWELSLTGLRNPTRVGVETRFDVIARNSQGRADNNVTLAITLPPGVNFLGVIDGEGNQLQAQQNQGVWVLNPYQFVRAGETLRFSFTFSPIVPQETTVGVMVRSANIPAGKQVFERVSVLAQ